MKKLIIAASILAVGSLSAFAGSGGCNGDCGDKAKGDKGKEAPKESAVTHVVEA